MCENNKCDICEGVIEDGVEHYSCAVMNERFNDGLYDVYNAEGCITTCSGCQEKFNVEDEINRNLVAFIKQAKTIDKTKSNITPIHNHYNCQRCNSPIRDGETLTTVNHYRETWNGHTIKPIKAWMLEPLCQSCATNIDIRTAAFKVTDEIIKKAKRVNDKRLTKVYF